MPNNNMFGLPSKEIGKDQQGPFETGDAVLILKANGEVVPMLVGIDATSITAAMAADEDLTEEQQIHLDQSEKLFNLVMAAKSPIIMKILNDLSNDLVEAREEDISPSMIRSVISRMH